MENGRKMRKLDGEERGEFGKGKGEGYPIQNDRLDPPTLINIRCGRLTPQPTVGDDSRCHIDVGTRTLTVTKMSVPDCGSRTWTPRWPWRSVRRRRSTAINAADRQCPNEQSSYIACRAVGQIHATPKPETRLRLSAYYGYRMSRHLLSPSFPAVRAIHSPWSPPACLRYHISLEKAWAQPVNSGRSFDPVLVMGILPPLLSSVYARSLRSFRYYSHHRLLLRNYSHVCPATAETKPYSP